MQILHESITFQSVELMNNHETVVVNYFIHLYLCEKHKAIVSLTVSSMR